MAKKFKKVKFDQPRAANESGPERQLVRKYSNPRGPKASTREILAEEELSKQEKRQLKLALKAANQSLADAATSAWRNRENPTLNLPKANIKLAQAQRTAKNLALRTARLKRGSQPGAWARDL